MLVSSLFSYYLNTIFTYIYDALVRSLVNRFKEFRRPKKPRNLPSAECVTPPKTKGRLPGITNAVKTPICPPGEDAVSYERHTKALQMEYKKTNRNGRVIDDLMERSFALRRAEIEEKNYVVETLFNRFPFLQEVDQICVGVVSTTRIMCMFSVYSLHISKSYTNSPILYVAMF